MAAMNCVGELQRVLHQCCGILVKPLSAFFGYPPFDFIFKFLLMAFFSHDLGQLSHPFPLSLLATFIASPILTNIQQAAGYICLCCSALQNCCLYNMDLFLPRHSVSLARCEVFWFLSMRLILRSRCFVLWLVCFFSDILLQCLCYGLSI